jgi:hypothetical protein
LVAPDRPGELARTIRVLLDFPDRRAALAANARAAVTTWDESVSQLREVYARHGLQADWIAA